MCNKGEGDFLGFDSLKVSIIIFPFVLFIDSIVKVYVRVYVNTYLTIVITLIKILHFQLTTFFCTIKSNKKKKISRLRCYF